MHGTIVVADKSKTVRRMVEIALAKHPFELHFAEDGNAASAAIKSKSPVIAILDAALPGIDGYDLTQQIKGAGDVKVILLVGRNSTYNVGRGRSAGVDDHLSKPFLTQKLVEKVFGALGESVPDAAIFRTSLLSIPLASGGTASPGGLTGSLGGAEPAVAPKAPPSIAAQPPAEPAVAPPVSLAAPTPFDDNEATRQYEPPAEAASAAADNAARLVLDAAGLKDALGEDGPARELFERVVWEVVPQLAEAILKEEIAKVVRERMAQAG